MSWKELRIKNWRSGIWNFFCVVIYRWLSLSRSRAHTQEGAEKTTNSLASQRERESWMSRKMEMKRIKIGKKNKMDFNWDVFDFLIFWFLKDDSFVCLLPKILSLSLSVVETVVCLSSKHKHSRRFILLFLFLRLLLYFLFGLLPTLPRTHGACFSSLFSH